MLISSALMTSMPSSVVNQGILLRQLTEVSRSFSVSDHDFTKAKLTPSVSLVCDIPCSIEESFYRGRVFTCLKDSVFQHSSPLRHGAELYKLLQNIEYKPILCLYSDSGPDHRVTYLSVQVSLICLFQALDLDFLIAARTAPHNSFRIPVERIMSLLNIGLQAVGIMREKPSDQFEAILKSANSMEDIRKIATKADNFKEEFISSLLPPLELGVLGSPLCLQALLFFNSQVWISRLCNMLCAQAPSRSIPAVIFIS